MTFAIEKWKPVVGYEGAYAVSNFGRVKSLSRLSISGKQLREKVMRARATNKYGHLGVSLRRGGVRAERYVHELVLTAFVSARPVGCECRHLDGRASNNRVSNLTWGTHKENIRDSFRHRTFAWGCNNGNSRLSRSEVRKIFLARGKKEYLASSYGISRTGVCRIKLGRTYKHETVDLRIAKADREEQKHGDS